MGEWLLLGLVLLTYPLAVLMVAITGPHNETERREYEQLKHERRRKRHSTGGR